MPREARNPDLHAAVLANPDDDAPRLVYADWLTDRGDPWGELITVQIARTRADTPALAAREAELLAALPTPKDLEPVRTYRRGFVEVLECHPADLDDILADTCVRELRVFRNSLDADRAKVAAAIPRMRLRSFSTCPVADADLEPLLVALRDARIEHLDYGQDQDPASVWQTMAIVQSGLLVSSLALYFLDASVLPALAAWHPLRSLSLVRGRMVDGDFARFVATPAFAGLEHLELSGSTVGARDVRAICDSQMPLVSLGLTTTKLDADSARRIANTPRFASLERLRIANAGIGADGIDALLASPYLSRDLVLGLDYRALGLKHIVNGSGNTYEVPDVPGMLERFSTRFAIEADGPYVLYEE